VTNTAARVLPPSDRRRPDWARLALALLATAVLAASYFPAAGTSERVSLGVSMTIGMVTAQMILNLLEGRGVRVFMGAVVSRQPSWCLCPVEGMDGSPSGG